MAVKLNPSRKRYLTNWALGCLANAEYDEAIDKCKPPSSST